jgi:hypothetical protein
LTTNYNLNWFSFFLPPEYEQLFAPCPIFGKYVTNFTLPLVPVDPLFFDPGEYRLDVGFVTDNDALLWRIKAYVYAEGNE